MNDTIRLIQNHRSVREYLPREVSEEMIEEIVRSAQSAATSSFVQAYTVIAVRDPKIKRELAELSGNRHVETCSVALVFCADVRRMMEAAGAGDRGGELSNAELFIVVTVDTALAAENAALAAESMGLGICFVGGIRNQIREVTRLLEIPRFVYPVFALTVGYPAERPEKKPRLPLEVVLHRNRYEPDRDVHIADYDQTVSAYYRARTEGKRTHGWSEYVARVLQAPRRPFMLDYLREQGFLEDTRGEPRQS